LFQRVTTRYDALEVQIRRVNWVKPHNKVISVQVASVPNEVFPDSFLAGYVAYGPAFAPQWHAGLQTG
jgi:hypothetical protein